MLRRSESECGQGISSLSEKSNDAENHNRPSDSSDEGGIMADYQMTLVDRQRIARGTMTFWLDTNGSNYDFRAGQHADFAFMQPPVGDESDNSRTFSLANSPHDTGLVMIAMRMQETGFKRALMSAALGTKFRVSRARGSFTLHKDFDRPAVFLAGGIGITPVLSILDWATRERMPHKLYLFYSNREAVDAAFLEELKDLAVQNPRFTLIPTVTQISGPAWPYETGRINREMLSRYLTGLNRPVFYIAGPSGMVKAMSDLLRSLDVSDDDVRTEEFGDYKVVENPVRANQISQR
jgi:ferredoxin-NADP reductase